MARRESKPGRREQPARAGRKPGGLFMGVIIGLVVGLVAAAGLAWYFNVRTGEFKPTEPTPRPSAPAQRHEPVAPAAAPEPAAVAKPAQARPVQGKPVRAKPHESAEIPLTDEKPWTSEPGKAPAAPIVERKQAAQSRVPLTFYGILPGDKPAKPVEPPKPKELWWLQVAALKSPADADKLKARLSLLGLEVATQKTEAAGQTLYRVRVGPYQRDEDAFADLDTLAGQNYEPRLLKEPVKPE